MTKRDRELLAQFTAVPHARHGNTRAWSVTGASLHLGQTVILHAMHSAKSAIKKAIAQDAAESEMLAGTENPLDVLDAAEVQVRATMADGDARNRSLDLLDIARGEVTCD